MGPKTSPSATGRNKFEKQQQQNCSFGRYCTKEKLFIVVHLILGD